jgi:hypothetical protein
MTQPMKEPNARRTPATGQQVAAIVGRIDYSKLAAIAALRPTVEEVEEAVAWATGESDVMGKSRYPLSGAAARVFEILTTELPPDSDREEP